MARRAIGQAVVVVVVLAAVAAIGPPRATSAETAVIRGRITDRNGSPIADYCVSTGPPNEWWSNDSWYRPTVRTDEDGRYKLVVAAPGDHDLWFERCHDGARPGHVGETYVARETAERPNRNPVGYDGEAARSIHVEPGQVVVRRDARLRRAGAIRGVVVSAFSGSPRPGVCVRALATDEPVSMTDYRQTITDEAGRFTLAGLPDVRPTGGDVKVEVTGCSELSGSVAGEFWRNEGSWDTADPVGVVAGRTRELPAPIAVDEPH